MIEVGGRGGGRGKTLVMRCELVKRGGWVE